MGIMGYQKKINQNQPWGTLSIWFFLVTLPSHKDHIIFILNIHTDINISVLIRHRQYVSVYIHAFMEFIDYKKSVLCQPYLDFKMAAIIRSCNILAIQALRMTIVVSKPIFQSRSPIRIVCAYQLYINGQMAVKYQYGYHQKSKLKNILPIKSVRP